MNKLVIFIITLLCVCGCMECPQNIKDTPVDSDEWIVEKKEKGDFMIATKRYLMISNVKTKRLTTIEVGDYTFEHTSLGDTIVYRF